MVHGPDHWPLNVMKSSLTLSRETVRKHDVSTSVLDCRDGVLGVIVSISLPPNTTSRVDAKELHFGLIWPEEENNFLFVTYTIIQRITSSEMCSLHLTHPSTHTWSSGQPTLQRPGSRGAVGGSVPCSRVSPQSWIIPAGAEIRTHNLGFKVQCSIH